MHCVQDTRGAELHAELDRARINEVVRKGTDPTIDSYSGVLRQRQEDGDRPGATWLSERWISGST